MRAFARHRDPLVEASNWSAIIIGTHLPLWPLYVCWVAGSQAWPSSICTVAFTPLFLLVPVISRRSGRAARIAMLCTGVANTVFTMWVLGRNTGTDLFFVPCAALASILFRRSERWLMLLFTLIPVAVWYTLQFYPLGALHHYDERSARALFRLNALSIAVLIMAFGWLQADVYREMEKV